MLDQALATEEVQYIIPARLALVEHAWLQGGLPKAHEQLALLAALEPATLHSWSEGELQVWASRTGFSLPGRTGLAVAPPFRAELDQDGALAARLWSELGAPCSAAIALMASAGQDAGTHLATAIRHLVPTGADGLIASARKLAAAHGVEAQMPRMRRGPYSAARSNLLGLTKREQEILRLMTAGATNRDIAGQLSRSQRTVEHHVSALLSNLNVANRFEAMMRIRNEPWILEDPLDNVRAGCRR